MNEQIDPNDPTDEQLLGAVEKLPDPLSGATDAEPTDAALEEAAVLSAEIQRTAELRQLDTIFRASTFKKADQHGRVLELSKATGAPTDIVEANIEGFSRAAELSDWDPQKFYRDNPILTRILLDRPDAAAVVMRKPELGLIGKLGSYMRETAASWAAEEVASTAGGAQAAGSPLAGELQGEAQAAGQQAQATAAKEQKLRTNPDAVPTVVASQEQLAGIERVLGRGWHVDFGRGGFINARTAKGGGGVSADIPPPWLDALTHAIDDQLGLGFLGAARTGKVLYAKQRGVEPDTYDLDKQIADIRNRPAPGSYGGGFVEDAVVESMKFLPWMGAAGGAGAIFGRVGSFLANVALVPEAVYVDVPAPGQADAVTQLDSCGAGAILSNDSHPLPPIGERDGQTMEDQLGGVGRIDIDGFIGDTVPQRCADCSPVSAWRVLAEIESLREQGARVLLVSVTYSPGGLVDDAIRIYDALRAFSRGGGRVVMYVGAYAGSAAPFVVLAGDVVVIDPVASLVVHSAYGDTDDPTALAGAIASANQRLLDVAASRTWTSQEELKQWLSSECTIVRPEEALAKGWADVVGRREVAANTAVQLARGCSPSSPRWKMLERTGQIAALRPVTSASNMKRPAQGHTERRTLDPIDALLEERRKIQDAASSAPTVTAVIRMREALFKAFSDGDEDTLDRLLAACEALAIVGGYPVNQPKRTLKYLLDPSDTSPAGAASGVIYGERDAQPANPFTLPRRY